MAYNGNADDYMRQAQSNAQARLQAVFDAAVQRCQQSDIEIDKQAAKFGEVYSENLNAQQAQDQSLEQHFFSLEQQQSAMAQETEQVYEKALGEIEQLQGQSSESEVEKLNRLFYGG